MTKFFPRQLLYRLRNEIPVVKLVPQLDWPHKHREGRFCFLCPRCGEFLTVQEMGGFQMVRCKMDDELANLGKAQCDTPALTVK